MLSLHLEYTSNSKPFDLLKFAGKNQNQNHCPEHYKNAWTLLFMVGASGEFLSALGGLQHWDIILHSEVTIPLQKWSKKRDSKAAEWGNFFGHTVSVQPNCHLFGLPLSLFLIHHRPPDCQTDLVGHSIWLVQVDGAKLTSKQLLVTRVVSPDTIF
jgi:hypothetical protein